MTPIKVGQFAIGGSSAPLAVIAGPCVIESLDLCREIAGYVKLVCDKLGMPYIFKASFDKANRTSRTAFRGEGIDAGLAVLSKIKQEFNVPVLTDIHESWQAGPVAEAVDVLQIPAFLCRQTDLLLAAAATGKVINIKKAQFLAPWDMKNVVDKVRSAGNDKILLTERGTSFGYNSLVVDMKSLPIMRALGCPVVYDGTHSVQQPGGLGTASGGLREFIPHGVRAAAAVGIDALFLEVHPDPVHALSDAATMLSLFDLEQVLTEANAIRNAINDLTSSK